MGTFLLPKTICQRLDSLFSNFWWGHNPSGSPKLHLRAWKALCCPKNLGGLGFRESHHHNRALMAKHAWDIIQEVNRPHIHLLKARYFNDIPFLHHSPKSNSSFFWKGLCKIQDLIMKGSCYRIANGAMVNIWTDPWVPNIEGFKPNPREGANSRLVTWARSSLMKTHIGGM